MKKILVTAIGIFSVMRIDAVTLNVSVPPSTKSCFVAGAFNDWNAGEAVKMVKDSDDHFYLDMPDVAESMIAQGYKYLSGPAWKYVEKDANGGEINNRTSPGNDVVGSWAELYNPDIKSIEVNINCYNRMLRVALPEDYDSSEEIYPVVYMVGVQQRYSSAGSDDAGDDFFGPDSWNMVKCMEELKAKTGRSCIVAGVYAFVAESIPFETDEFAGSGDADNFLKDYITEVIEYVKHNFRVDTSVAATTLVGADLGGNLAIYAAVNHPDLFGKCIAMSPMLWINREEINSLVSKTPDDTRFVLTYGSLESDVIKKDIIDLAASIGENVDIIEIKGGLHDDTTWGDAIRYISPIFTDNNFIPKPEIDCSAKSLRMAKLSNIDLNAADLSFYYTETSSNPVLDSSVAFTCIDNYLSTSGQRQAVLALVKDISKNFKSKCYWNVMDNNTGEFIGEKGNVSFSSKKSAESWLRIVVGSDGVAKSIAASSIGFRVVAADETVTMTPGSDHHALATVKFTGDDKTFTIHFGSVNSQSDMGEVSSVFSVGENCLEAEIDYDFLCNDVKITETKHGQQLGKVKVEYFTANPAVTTVGGTSLIALKLEGEMTPELTVSYNYGPAVQISLEKNSASGEWRAHLADLSEGIYHLNLNCRSGEFFKEDVAVIAVKVLDELSTDTPTLLTVNAYDNVNWETTGRYKSNFHTHTSQSFDTSFATHEVVDLYHNAGYSILALTDHDFNPYPWTLFDLFNHNALNRDPKQLNMLAIPGNELSKDNNNSWSESTGGEFNHHNDFFTGRKGQEFASLRESYVYTSALGGMQIINHPGQYWRLDKDYNPGEKNSPEWHAENFRMFESLIGLEVYNQGNRRPNDRILWDQILEMTMPNRPVWGYSCDDTHTREQYFRNYQFMLMPSLTVEDLKEAMASGCQYFSYEYTGSGEAKAPRINSISIDKVAGNITIDTDGDNIYWIYSTDKKDGGSPSSRKSTVVGMGNTFDYNGYKGKYVRALIKNEFGETCTQPFGFSCSTSLATISDTNSEYNFFVVYDNLDRSVKITSTHPLKCADIYSVSGICAIHAELSGISDEVSVAGLLPGIYIIRVYGDTDDYSSKVVIR